MNLFETELRVQAVLYAPWLKFLGIDTGNYGKCTLLVKFMGFEVFPALFGYDFTPT